jgi:hypothetical protein
MILKKGSKMALTSVSLCALLVAKTNSFMCNILFKKQPTAKIIIFGNKNA